MLENTGLEQIALRMPPQCALHRLSVDGLPMPITASAQSAGSLAVSLPAGVRFPVITVQFATSQRPPAMVDDVHLQLPDIGLAVLNYCWDVQLPPSYSVCSSTQPLRGSAALASTWTSRLFGPLAGSRQRPFDLFDLRDWRGLLDSSVAGAPRGTSSSLEPEDWAVPRAARAGLLGASQSWPMGLTETGSADRVWTMQWAGQPRASLQIYRQETLRYWGWALFLALVVAGGWLVSRRAVTWPALLVLAGSAAAH